MASVLTQLIERNILKRGEYPVWLQNAIHYETIMGSIAYGVNEDTSDFDVYAVCIPPKQMLFPHLAGHIPGFGKQPEIFNNWQKHHIDDPDAEGGRGRNYDFSVYSIVQFFQKCAECNPNMVDALFTPRRCVLYTSPVGELIRENRHLFLHKGAWHRFKGYAYQQMHKMQSMKREGKRAATVEKYGYDIKFAYHVVRLMDEVEQILNEQTLDLERAREQLKSIRRGEWAKEKIIEFFNDREKQLEEAYQKSPLPYKPDYNKLQELLLQCLEIAYDDVRQIVHVENEAALAIEKIQDVLNEYLRKAKANG